MKKTGLPGKFICMILAACLFSSCQSEGSDTGLAVKENVAGPLSMLDAAELDYEVPVNYPGILVDTYGYEAGEKKEAIFVAGNLPTAFSIKNKNGLTVYEGHIKLKEVTEDADGKLTGVGEFTDLTEPGEYMITADFLGESLPFKVTDGKMPGLLERSLKELEGFKSNDELVAPFEGDPGRTLDVSGGFVTDENGGKDVVTGCLTVLDLLTAYEYHPASFKDVSGGVDGANGIPDVLDLAKYEIDWLIKMQNPDSGGVYTSVSMQNAGANGEPILVVGGETTKATAYYTAALAKFSYIYRRFDYSFAGRCQSLAEKAWSCMESNKDIMSVEQEFRAATEMYRLTGYTAYHNVIKAYLQDNSTKPFESRVTLDGAITYLSTSRATDMRYCTNLMEAFMDRTEQKMLDAEASRYMVEYEDMTGVDILRNTTELVVVDSVIPNVEYENLERNYLHYMLGRNKECTDHFSGNDNPDYYAELAVLIAKLCENEE